MINIILVQKLIRDSDKLLKMIDELLKSLKKALDKKYLLKTEMRFLKKSVKRILDMAKVFIENYNKFLTTQIDIKINQ